MAEKIRWSSEPATIEALGSTKIGNLGGFLARNATPASLLQRSAHWIRRVQETFVHCPRAGMKPIWILAFAISSHQYLLKYHFSPMIKKHQARKYH